MSIFPPDPTELCPFHCDCASAFTELATLRTQVAEMANLVERMRAEKADAALGRRIKTEEARETELRSGSNADLVEVIDRRDADIRHLRAALSTARAEADLMRRILEHDKLTEIITWAMCSLAGGGCEGKWSPCDTCASEGSAAATAIRTQL